MVDALDDELQETSTMPDGNAGTSVTFEVHGLPPAKSETKSMLSPTHGHRDRVLGLLGAARAAMTECGTDRLSGLLALDVVVMVPAPHAPSDATNYLGGICDVLQQRETGADVSHLGELATFGLFADDKQVRDISYREEPGNEGRYRVTLREL